MRWCVAQYHIGHRNDDIKDLMAWNSQLCSQFNVKYCDLTEEETLLHSVPPYWSKVKGVMMLAERERQNIDAILWLDSDAALSKYGIKNLSCLFKTPQQFFSFSSDCPEWTSPFNAGVWAVRNDGDGRRLLERWFAKFLPDAWTLVDRKSHKWECYGHFAGYFYEQASMVEIIFSSHEYVENIDYQIMSWAALQATPTHYVRGVCIMTYHFAGPFKKQIREALEMKFPHVAHFWCRRDGKTMIPDDELGQELRMHI